MARNKLSPWLIEDVGRQCSYSGEGNCGHVYKPWSEFNKGNGARGYNGWCRDCSKVHNNNLPLDARRHSAMIRNLRKYNLTLGQYNALVGRYEGRCWRCRQFETKKNPDGSIQRLSVDHDHSCCPGDKSCGKCIRGVVCVACNYVIDSVLKHGLASLVEYLEAGHVDLEDI